MSEITHVENLQGPQVMETCSQMKPNQKLIFSNLNLRLFRQAGMYIASECNTLKVICAGVHCIQTEPKIAPT